MSGEKYTEKWFNLNDALHQLMVITMEECGELTQACSKAIRKKKFYDFDQLKDEIGDVYTMICLLQKFDIVSWEELENRKNVKEEKLKKWSNLIE